MKINFATTAAARNQLWRALVLVAMSTSASVMAFTPELDRSFGSNGVVTKTWPGQPSYVAKIFVQADGKFLASGIFLSRPTSPGYIGPPIPYGVLARFRTDGTPDAGFGNAGFMSPITALPQLLLADDKTIGVGVSGLVRRNGDGTPDAQFNSQGAEGIAWFPYLSNISVTHQRDGRIVVAGSPWDQRMIVLMRFNADGSLDRSFGGSGIVTTPMEEQQVEYPLSVATSADGKIVVAVSTIRFSVIAGSLQLRRYDANGAVDGSFADAGRATIAMVGRTPGDIGKLWRQSNGRWVIASTYTDADNSRGGLLAAFEPSGKVDSTFGALGIATFGTTIPPSAIGFGGVSQQADAKIIVGLEGYGDPRVVTVYRFQPDGSPDTAFGTNGSVSIPVLSRLLSVTLQSDGKLLLGGSSVSGEFALARYLIGPTAAVEFYNAALDHYFLTINPGEAVDLDEGLHAGWARTGRSFLVYGGGATENGHSPLCRFYIPPNRGDSHFFSADDAECAAVLTKMQTDPNYLGYVFETPNAFQAILPDRITGDCPAGTSGVFRLWNNRTDSNHRYTTDASIKAQMLAQGYLAEGYGPSAVAMCAPSQ